MIAHITITTAKLAETIEFYQWLLSLPISGKITTPTNEIVFLGSNETKLELISDANAPMINAKGITIGFLVDSLNDKIAMLDQKNIPHSQVITVPNAKFMFFVDLNGCNIQLFENMQ